MTQRCSIFFAIAVFLTNILSAQSISENFNSGLASLTAKAWKFSNITLETSPSLVIQGQSIGTSSKGLYSLATPFYDFSGTIDVSLDYRISEKLKGNATHTIEIGLLDTAGNFLPLASATFNKSSTTALNRFKASGLSVNGTKRLVVRVDARSDRGQTHVILDNLNVTGGLLYHYGTASLNSAPTAVNDFFSSASLTTFTGSVLENDSDPNTGESVVRALLVSAPDEPGKFVLNHDGKFSFTPSAEFTGGAVIFTYKAIDNGYGSSQSNLATVVINYPPKAIPPVYSMCF